jgi:hypothetical protein
VRDEERVSDRGRKVERGVEEEEEIAFSVEGGEEGEKHATVK